MEMEPAFSVVALLIAVVSAAVAFFSARETRAQTNLQRQLREDALQPQVWVDIRPDDSQGTVLQLVVGNNGPTTARSVQVVIDRPLPAIPQFSEGVRRAEGTLARGITSLTPGRVHRWPLGPGFELMNGSHDQTFIVSIHVVGPFGSVHEEEATIDLAQWSETSDQPNGSLHQVRQAIDRLGQPGKWRG